MARQKPVPKQHSSIEEAQKDTEPSPDVQNSASPESASVLEKAKGTDHPSESASPSISDDDDIPDMTAEELRAEGQRFEGENNHDEAVRFFDYAVRTKLRELNVENANGVNELNPQMAEFWLRYGDAVFTRIEATEELFNLTNKVNSCDDIDADDDKKLAWDTLDTARVCFEQMIGDSEFPPPANPKIANLMLWLENQLAKEKNTEPLWCMHVSELSRGTLTNLNLLRYCRMRLGDFKMAFSMYQDAVEEFAAALQICQSYGLAYSKALEVALPLAQCLMAANSPASVTVFRACLRLIQNEKDLQSPDAARIELLDSTFEDLERQLEEYVDNKEGLEEKVQEAIHHVQGGSPASADSVKGVEGAITNLGVISKRRRRDDAVSTEASQTEAAPINSNDKPAPGTEGISRDGESLDPSTTAVVNHSNCSG